MAIKLTTVALAGFAIAIAAAVVSLSLGGPHPGTGRGMIFGFPISAISFTPDHFHFGGGGCGNSSGGDVTTRTIPWTDQSDKIVIDLAANIDWAPGSGSNLILSGPAADLDQIKIDGNRITAGCDSNDFHKLNVTLPGRAFSQYEIDGFGQIHLKGLNQPSISLAINGAALVDAAGVVPQTDLTVSGAASINLNDLITQNLQADLSGASNLTANPAQSADIDLSGAGLVTLLTRPRNYHADISGLGHVDVPDQPSQAE